MGLKDKKHTKRLMKWAIIAKLLSFVRPADFSSIFGTLNALFLFLLHNILLWVLGAIDYWNMSLSHIPGGPPKTEQSIQSDFSGLCSDQQLSFFHLAG